MNNLSLKQFRYFEALARLGHFGRAAEVCAISQPALSMQIKEMEAALGTALFERGPRQVRLTHFGEAFALRVREILRQVDELGDLARAAARLQAVAPKLRAKAAGRAVDLFLSRDALVPGALAFMSDRAARRLCDRLVALGAVRELTGRDTFRLYGV